MDFKSFLVSLFISFLYPSIWLQFREALKQVLNFENVFKSRCSPTPWKRRLTLSALQSKKFCHFPTGCPPYFSHVLACYFRLRISALLEEMQKMSISRLDEFKSVFLSLAITFNFFFSCKMNKFI